MRLKSSLAGVLPGLFATGSATLAALALLTGSAFGADPSCKQVNEATTKYLTIPTHIYTTESGPATGGKTRNTESIYLIDKAYVLVNGRWRVSPVTPKMMVNDLKEARANAESNAHSTCQMVREEAINGEAATLYSSHSETAETKTDSQMWISKSRGVPLKLELNTDLGGGAGKRHRVSRFEYTNVQAPQGVQ